MKGRPHQVQARDQRVTVHQPARDEPPLIEVDGLAVSYRTRRGDVRAVRDVSFSVRRGESFGIVGESGSGKSTVAFSLVNFLGAGGRITQGRLTFQGRDLRSLDDRELARLRGRHIAMVYQDPSLALNPSLRVGEQLMEVLEIHRAAGREEARRASIEMLRRVHIPDPETVMTRFPHQLSGGQQQRVVIAMALLSDPSLLILDEPTTALDVTVEAAVLDLVDELRRELDAAVIYITHDLGVVARVCDTVGVMYAGEMVERAPVVDIFRRPAHPYTLGLLRCLPDLGRSKYSGTLTPIPGHVPRPDEELAGCRFAPRCPYATERCHGESPALRQLDDGHLARCHWAEKVQEDGGRGPVVASPLRSAGSRNGEPAPVTLDVKQLKAYYRQEESGIVARLRKNVRYVKAVDGVSLTLRQGCTLGIVGESGCGKSTLARTIAGLERPTEGTIRLLGGDVTAPVEQRSFADIRRLQMVFQHPDSTLNPSFSVGYQIGRALQKLGGVPGSRVKDEVVRLLQAVKLNASYYDRLPHQLSGGEKQRVAIARAIAARPEVLICDEPLSALDVSVQAAIINLLVEIQREYGMSILFIAHDLSVVRYLSDDVAIMYLGNVCEMGPAEAVFAPPYHPYTEALLSAIPLPDPTLRPKPVRLDGQVPSALNPPPGCPFHTRCPHKAGDICEREVPPARVSGEGHVIYCHLPLDELPAQEPFAHAAASSAAASSGEKVPGGIRS